jgi:glycine dehydrogenase subunit 1
MSPHPYISIGSEDKQKMLSVLGLSSTEDLFAHISRDVPEFKMSRGRSEWEVAQLAQDRSHQNASTHDAVHFLGAGVYDHWYPAVIDHIVMRGEFLTSYTPYQPEVSQGTLQVIYEFQSLMCRFFGMDVCNASVYDGAHALVETVMMAERLKHHPERPSVVLLSHGVHPEYVEVLKTCLVSFPNLRLIQVPLERQSGVTLWDHVKIPTEANVIACVGQVPSFFGVMDPVRALVECAEHHQALSICLTYEPYAFAVHPAPGEVGVDLVAAELQSFGVPPGFGGPHIGAVLCKKAYIRHLPGRLVARTRTLSGGREAFTLTLSTREQHIRREKATSNICTNQGLLVNRVLAHCCLLGDPGVREIALQNMAGATEAFRLFSPFLRPLFPRGEFFNEFALELDEGMARRVKELQSERFYLGVTREMLSFDGLIPGGGKEHYYQNFMVTCVTEKRTEADLHAVVRKLEGMRT